MLRAAKRHLVRAHMTFDTQVLCADALSIHFGPDGATIDDATTRQLLAVAAHELTATTNAVAFPTETVYGLGGSALCDELVRSIYRAKNRPADNPLIVHVSLAQQLERKLRAHIPSVYHRLIAEFWPGPLTILLPLDATLPISPLVTAGQDTFAVRVPANAVARALIALSDTPLAAPLANASTRPSPTLALHVLHDLRGKIPYILDAGDCDVGVELTVVDGLVDPPVLLRPGGVSIEQIRRVGGGRWRDVVVAKRTAATNEAVRTPGMKYRHYSPTARVVLFTNCGDGVCAVRRYLERARGRIALLRARHFAPAPQISSRIELERAMGASGAEILRSMFRLLREVDEAGVDVILVEGIAETDEGLAVMNRLGKAAAETIDGEMH